MPGVRVKPERKRRYIGRVLDWAEVRRLASERLARELERKRELSPRLAAETVAQMLPARLGTWLMSALESRGWLGGGARIRFDVLDGDDCPAAFRGPVREIVRLAVFGLPGQGRPSFKHREASYQQICAQIMREANDLPTLSGAASRALNHPDVCGDPGLASMVRAFIVEREAALRTKQRVEHPEPEDNTQVRKAFEELGSGEFPTRQQLMRSYWRYEKDFEVHLAQYNEAAARYALDELRDLARRYPVHVDQAGIQQHEQQLQEFLGRCAQMQQQIEDVARQAAAAARQGDEKTASWLLHRLRAIHALTPVLLPPERFEALREEIEQSGQRHEHSEALRELIAREREVAAEIKKAAAAIYRFHKVARTTPPESEEYKRAELTYREAVIRVKVRDTDWLACLLLELETFLQELDDPTGKAEAQLDRFVGTVRTALSQLRQEIRAIQQERAAAARPDRFPEPPPPAAESAAQPPT